MRIPRPILFLYLSALANGAPAWAHHEVDDALLPGYAPAVAPSASDNEVPTSHQLAGPVPIRPSDYVPLAVGNRWTYEHYYYNGTYLWGASSERMKRLEIPGYPYGKGHPTPPDSLIRAERILTIEITHTQAINDREYFVFSDADYTWPPRSDMFWGGKTVRLSDEGFLIYHLNGQDVPVYDLDHHHPGARLKNMYSCMLPGEYGLTEIRTERRLDEPFTDEPFIPFLHGSAKAGALPTRPSVLHFDYVYPGQAGEHFSYFLSGYGIGQFFSRFTVTVHSSVYKNFITPVSASIDGAEFPYPRQMLESTDPPPAPYAVDFYEDVIEAESDTATQVRPSSWGDLKQRVPKARRRE